MSDRNAYFLGYRIKVDEDNFITYVYGSDPETGAVQVYLAPWKYEGKNDYKTKDDPSIDPRTDLMPNADAIPTPSEVTTGTDSPRRSSDTVHVPSIYRAR